MVEGRMSEDNKQGDLLPPVGGGDDEPVGRVSDTQYYKRIPQGSHSGRGTYIPTGYPGTADDDSNTMPESQGGLGSTWLDNMRRYPGPGFDMNRWRQYDDWDQNRRGRGRGSGSSGMRFDQDYLVQTITDWWRQNMVEPPSNVNSLVAEYVVASRNFGSALNLDAWLWQRARKEPRYTVLYGRKPAELSEAEYIGQLRGVAEQAGLSGGAFNEQVTAGAQAGQSAQGFASRVSDLRQVRTGNLGLFSRKVAQTVASLGSLGRGR